MNKYQNVQEIAGNNTPLDEYKNTILSLYGRYRIPSIMMEGGSNEVRKTIKNASIGALLKQDESGEDIFIEYLQSEDDYDDEDGYGEEVDDEEYDWQKFSPYAFCNKAIYKPTLTSSYRRFTLHIQLQGIRPAIYRDIEVPSNLRLDSLAGLILTAMGWQDEHLHRFVTVGRYPQYYSTSPNDDEFDTFQVNDGKKYCIGDLLLIVGDKIKFEYDFGDDWIHVVTLTAISDGEKKPMVQLLDGKRACPPEDCGGIGGYEELCEAMKDLKSDHAKEMIEWMGCKYDPELFPLEIAQKLVKNFNKK